MTRMHLNEWHPDKLLCSVDPITLTGLALAAGGGLAASSALSSGSGAPAAPVIPQAAPPQQNPTGTPNQTPAGNQPTFIGAAATPPVQSGQKSLLGQ